MSLPGWISKQSVVVPFCWWDGDINVVSVYKDGKLVLPSSPIEKGFKQYESAERAVYTLTGLIGKMCNEPIGTYSINDPHGDVLVSVYVIELLSDEYEHIECHSFSPLHIIDIECALREITNSSVKHIFREYCYTIN